MSKKIDYNSIPHIVELFGRTVTTIEDSDKLDIRQALGEARYGVNQIALATNIKNGSKLVASDELKLTYLHEMLHFILNFTGYEAMILDEKKIELEQFIELMASAIYQYEKTAKY